MAVASKYATKVRARVEAAALAGEETVKPDEIEFADLGKLPAICAEHLQKAREELGMASSVAAEMERMASPGVQKQEPRAVKLSCQAMAKKLRGLEKRAEHAR